MIVEYHRPHTVEEALTLLSREDPRTVPLGGGTFLNRGRFAADGPALAVVDLQELDLARVEQTGNILSIGAMATLQGLADRIDLPLAFRQAIQHEMNHNLRHGFQFRRDPGLRGWPFGPGHPAPCHGCPPGLGAWRERDRPGRLALPAWGV